MPPQASLLAMLKLDGDNYFKEGTCCQDLKMRFFFATDCFYVLFITPDSTAFISIHRHLTILDWQVFAFFLRLPETRLERAGIEPRSSCVASNRSNLYSADMGGFLVHPPHVVHQRRLL